MASALKSIALAAVALAAVHAAPALAQTAKTGLKLSGDLPVQVEGDRLDVFDDNGRAVFSGNVKVVQGDTLLRTEKLEIFYAGGAGADGGAGDIERIVASGKIYVRSGTQEATGDKGTFDMKSEVLTMSGSEVVLSDGGNAIVGCKLTVNMKTGIAKLDGCGSGGGRVSGVFKSRSAAGASQ